MERMAALAKDATKQEESVSSGAFISFKGGRLSYQGNPIKGDELDVVVLDSVLENCYYGGEYDPDNPQPPVCYAFGRTEEEMAPHANSSAPQSEKCAGCPMNEFGSAEKGKGKACKNVRRLGLIPGDNLSPEGVKTAEIAYAKLPVTSVKGWAAYVRALSTLDKVPPLGAVTTIGVVPDDKSQFRVTFNKSAIIPEKVLGAVFARHDSLKDEIMFPYPSPTAEEPPAKTKKPAGKRAKF
jgi:hypothetical protein